MHAANGRYNLRIALEEKYSLLAVSSQNWQLVRMNAAEINVLIAAAHRLFPKEVSSAQRRVG